MTRSTTRPEVHTRQNNRATDNQNRAYSKSIYRKLTYLLDGLLLVYFRILKPVGNPMIAVTSDLGKSNLLFTIETAGIAIRTSTPAALMKQ